MHFQLSIVSVIALAASTVLAGGEPISQNALARAALAKREAEASNSFISQNAAARFAANQRRALEAEAEAAAVIAPVRRSHAAHARRTIDLDGGRRFIARRATADQLAAQAKLNAYAAQLAQTNTEWQKDVMTDLKAGKTPKTFDEFAAGQPAASVSVSSSSSVSVSSGKKPSKKPASLAKEPETNDDDQDDDDEEDDNEDDEENNEDDEDEEDDEEEDDAPPPQKPATKPKVENKPKPQQSKPQPAQPKPETPKQPSNGGSSSGGPTNHGEGTFYGTGLGACGDDANDSMFIAAIAADRYDSKGKSNSSGQCGRRIEVCFQGKCTEVVVKDRCVGCAYQDIDLSPAAFNAIADPALGRIDVTWKFLDGQA